MTATLSNHQHHSVQEFSAPDASTQDTSQYTFSQILGIWLAAGVPMWVLGWLLYPA